MKQRITSYDTFRAIGAFLIVFLHYPLKLGWADEVTVLSRVVVPFFFMVSGYFNYSKELQLDKVKRELKKIISILVVVNLFYLAFRISVRTYYALRDGYSVLVTIGKILAQLTRKRFIFFNFGLAGHLWYLRAMIMALIILVLMKKLKLERLVKWSIPVVVILDLCLCKYSMLFFGYHFPRKYFEPLTKMIAVGYVYFFIGYFYREIEEKAAYKKIKQFAMKHWIVPLVIMIVFAVLNLLEYKWLVINELNVEPCNFAGTFFLAISLFSYLSFYPSLGCNTNLHVIGRKYSEYIYYYHVLAGKFLSLVFKDTVLYPFFYCTRTVIIFLSVLLSIKFVFYVTGIKRPCQSEKA